MEYGFLWLGFLQHIRFTEGIKTLSFKRSRLPDFMYYLISWSPQAVAGIKIIIVAGLLFCDSISPTRDVLCRSQLTDDD